eukprot:TRINITY_DN11876_c0_g1_i1.p1 TRINITY_DN11876_c0_g1~~TRINITY_DN11876_c0_g1_i1.p1  ORF type:complete len:166 (+),score=12.77 TRINITY_DN11876_c0_g1_i1:162-659(+)
MSQQQQYEVQQQQQQHSDSGDGQRRDLNLVKWDDIKMVQTLIERYKLTPNSLCDAHMSSAPTKPEAAERARVTAGLVPFWDGLCVVNEVDVSSACNVCGNCNRSPAKLFTFITKVRSGILLVSGTSGLRCAGLCSAVGWLASGSFCLMQMRCFNVDGSKLSSVCS